MSTESEDTLRLMAHLMRANDNINVSLTPDFLEEVANELETLRTEIRALVFELSRYIPDREYIYE